MSTFIPYISMNITIMPSTHYSDEPNLFVIRRLYSGSHLLLLLPRWAIPAQIMTKNSTKWCRLSRIGYGIGIDSMYTAHVREKLRIQFAGANQQFYKSLYNNDIKPYILTSSTRHFRSVVDKVASFTESSNTIYMPWFKTCCFVSHYAFKK